LPENVIEGQWPIISSRRPIRLPTAEGDVLVQLARVRSDNLLVVTSIFAVELPVVRFQSACVFGEGLHATDCDCGVQLQAATALVCREGGVLTYAWEEGRSLGIEKKMDAIALQQAEGIDTAEAFARLGMPAEPRTFENHVSALRMVFAGRKVRLASRNKAKIEALARAEIEVTERIDLDVPLTPERSSYLASKIAALGHISES
jgi:GTP cyclohydrolase II